MTSLQFEGNGFEYFKIWIVNILLIIVTLGLYYPWAKVRNLRYFYGNTALEGRNFDYHATGKQLFKSFLIALALLIVYLIIQQVSPIGSLLVLLLLFVAIPWIIWRSLMFGMRMTSFSNVRFSFVGGLSDSYINFLLLPVLLILCIYGIPVALVGFAAYRTYRAFSSSEYDPSGASSFDDDMGMGVGTIMAVFLGIIVGAVLAIYLFGLIKKRNAVYGISNTLYGQGRFQIALDTAVFVKILFKSIGLAFLMLNVFFILLVVIVTIAVGLDGLQQLGADSSSEAVVRDLIGNGAFIVVGSLVYLGMIAVGFLIAAYNYSRQRNYIVNNTLFDDKVAISSTVRARSLALLMMTNLLLVLCTFGLAFPWAKVRMARYVANNTHVDTEFGFDDYISQQENYQSSLGDQIGDAFDVDVGLAI